MPLIARKTAVLAKIETTYGTDAVPTGAANAVLVRSVNLTPMDTNMAERTLVRPYFGEFQKLPGTVSAKVEIEVEVSGSGAAGTAPAWGALMRACSHSETISAGVSVTYAPSSSSTDSVTIYVNVDGTQHKLTGARGTVSASFKVGEIPTWKFTFTGIYNAVADVAQPALTLTAWKQPVPVNNTNTTPFTLHGVSAVMSELAFDVKNNVVYRSLVGGAQAVLITDRKAGGKVTIEATPVATKDWWTAVTSATLGALAFTHGTVAGNKVSLNSSMLQLSNPDYSDMDGVQMMGADTSYVPTAGNDEYSIVVA